MGHHRNSDHLQFFVYDEKYAGRNPFFQMPSSRQSIAADGGAAEVYRISPDEPWRIVRTRWRVAGVVQGVVEGGGRVSGYFTGATGTTVYRGDAYGADFLNNTFTGDAGGQLVHRKTISAAGASLIGKRPDDELDYEFAASKDTWVRVVNFANAPDGCLHVIDMHREVIEHPWSLPEEIKKHLDLNSGNNRGRIFRIVPDRADWKRRSSIDFARANTDELVKALEHPNSWHRDTASRLLYERQDKAALPLLLKLLRESPEPLARLHALGAIDGLVACDEGVILRALTDRDAMVRERGIALSDKLFLSKAFSPPLLLALAVQVDHPNERVRFQLAFTLETALRLSPDNAELSKTFRYVLARMAANDHADRWLSAALLSGPPDVVTGALFQPMTQDHALAKKAAPFVAKLIEMRAASAKDAAALIDFIVADPSPLWIQALGEGLRRAGTSIEKADAGHKLAAIFIQAAATAIDVKSAMPARLEAIELLRFAAPQQAAASLNLCLGQGQSDEIQAAAIKALTQVAPGDLTIALLQKWLSFGTKARDAALKFCILHEERMVALLEAVQSGTVKPDELSASQVQSLSQHKDAKIASLAKTALASVILPARADMLAKFKPALELKGDAVSGQKQYVARCITCHRAAGQGFQAGPDLITVKTKGRDALLLAILDPNKEVAAQYVVYNIKRKDGQTFSGIISKDDANSTTLRMPGGAEQTIPRNQISRTWSSGLSLMPEGLETGMDMQNMADLLAFIEAQK